MLLSLYIPLLAAATTVPPAAKPAAVVAPAPRASLSACAVVTRADVDQTLGPAIDKGDDQQEESASTCNYSRRRGQVSVTVQHLQKKLNIEVEVAKLKASIPDSVIREASGLGARAFFLDIPGAGTQLYVIHGDLDFLMVSVLGFGEAAQVSPAAEALARKALGRL